MADLNLATIAGGLPKNGYVPEGAIGGFQSGIQLADYLDNMDRARRQDDTSYASSQEDLRNKLANAPLEDAKRQLGLSEIGAKQDFYNSGDAQEAMKMDLKSKISDAMTKMNDNQLKAVQQQGDLAVKYMAEAEQGTMTPEEHAKYVQKFKTFGISIGPQGDPNTALLLGRMAHSAPITSQVLAERDRAERLAGSQYGQHQISAMATMYAADQSRTAAEARAGNAGDYKDQDQQTQNKIRAKPELTTGDILQFSGALNDDVKKMVDSTAISEAAGLAATNYNLHKEIRDVWDKKGGLQAYITSQRQELEASTKAKIMSEKLAGKPVKDKNGNVIIDEVGPNSVDQLKNILTGKTASSPTKTTTPTKSSEAPGSLKGNIIYDNAVKKYGTTDPVVLYARISEMQVNNAQDAATRQQFLNQLRAQFPSLESPVQKQPFVQEQPIMP